METVQKDNEITDIFLTHLNKPNNMLKFDEILTLCSKFHQLFAKATQDLVHSETSYWNKLSVVLYQLAMLKKILDAIFCHFTPTHKACFNILFQNDILKTLLVLSSCHEKSVKHSAQKTLAFIIVKFYDCKLFESHLKMFFELLFLQESTCAFEVVTILLKHMKSEKLDVPFEFRQFLLPFSENHLVKLKASTQIEQLYIRLLFIDEMFEVVSIPQSLLIVIFNCFTHWFKSIDVCSFDPIYRLHYLLSVKRCIKSQESLKDKVVITDAVKMFLRSVLSPKIVDYFVLQPTFVGFGGREVNNHPTVDRSCEGFSLAEKMVLVNAVLHALMVVVEQQDSFELFLTAENALFKFFKASEFFSGTFFEIYLEQDDAMIEFLLLHLNISILFRKKEKKFFVSPHLLFADMSRLLSFDHSVLLDWLSSNETQFLLYFLKYLKYLASDFQAFLTDVKSDCASSVMLMLQQLSMSIEKLRSKELFPFEIKPLLKVMHAVETLAVSNGINVEVDSQSSS